MAIDLELLSYEDLLELKLIIEKRLKYLNSIGSAVKKMHFEQGDEVYFAHPRLGRQKCTLLKFNEKTFTVITSTGQRWDVSPHLLRKVVHSGSKQKAGTVVTLRKKK